jgi:hypothetical protein
MELYWVTTVDHEEDWFIVATSSDEAAKLHENMEGYNPGDAIAEAILDIPKEISAEIGWPSEELLTALGAKFICESPSRVVEISGRKFCEGLLDSMIRSLDDDIFENSGQDRLNQTTKTTIH